MAHAATITILAILGHGPFMIGHPRAGHPAHATAMARGDAPAAPVDTGPNRDGPCFTAPAATPRSTPSIAVGQGAVQPPHVQPERASSWWRPHPPVRPPNVARALFQVYRL